jgi:hypothetical protein
MEIKHSWGMTHVGTDPDTDGGKVARIDVECLATARRDLEAAGYTVSDSRDDAGDTWIYWAKNGMSKLEAIKKELGRLGAEECGVDAEAASAVNANYTRFYDSQEEHYCRTDEALIALAGAAVGQYGNEHETIWQTLIRVPGAVPVATTINERDWARRGSETEAEDRARGNYGPITDDDLEAALAHHFDSDLAELDDVARENALSALVRGYRVGAS